MIRSNPRRDIQDENTRLRRRLSETEDILRALREGKADALLTTGPDGKPRYERRAGEMLYRLLIEEMSEGALTLARGGQILYANRRFAEMLGLVPAQIMGEKLERYVALAERDRLLRLLQEPLSESTRTEITFETAQRKHRIAQLTLRAWSANGVSAISALVTDITPRKRAERRAVYRAQLLDNVHDAIIATDDREAITFWNRAAEKMYGYTVSEAIGKPIHQLLRTEQSDRERAEFEQNLSETGQLQGNLLQYRKDDTPIYVAASMLTQRSKTGTVTGYIFVNQDITERLQAVGAMLESEQRFENLFDQTLTPTLVYRKTEDEFLLIRYNQAATELTRDAIPNYLGKPARDLFTALPEIALDIETCYREQRSIQLSTPFQVPLAGENKSLNLKFTFVAPDMVMLHAEDVTERLRAQEVLVAQAELLELTHDAIFVRDMAGRIVFWNNGAVNMYGIAKSEAIGALAPDLLHTQYPRPLDDIVDELLREGRWEGELIHTRHDSETIVISSRWALQRNARGEPEGILEINTDITEHTRAEEALRASEHRFRLAVDNFPGVFIIYDAQRRIQFINTPGLVLNGVPEKELLGKTDEEIFPEQVTAPYLPFLIRAAETGTVQSGEVDVTLAAGTFAEKVTYVPLLDDQGNITQILGIAEDITERKAAEEELKRLYQELEQRVVERTAELEKANRALVGEVAERTRAQEALKQSEERFRLLAENAQDMIYRIRLSPERQYEYVSPSATTITGYAPEEFYADPDLGLKTVYPDDYPILDRVNRGEYDSGTPMTVRWAHKDGTTIWMELRNVPIYDAGGNLVATEGIARDVTERKRAEEALQAANENLISWAGELEQRNREITLLNEMGDLLQSCLTVEEAHRVTAASAPELFPGSTGALYILNDSRTLLEAAAMWGDASAESVEHIFVPDNCWALRRGRLHIYDHPGNGLVCQHVGQLGRVPPRYVCIPMVAQGETLGILYLQAEDPAQLGEAVQRLAVSVAEHVALAISSLRLRDTLRSQAIRDPLTGLFNRRYMEESLDRELRRAARKRTPVSIVMLDLDHFKMFNDNFGHDVGDAVLRTFGHFLQSHIREGDIACRYGGEEFTLILPETTLEGAQARAEQICREFREVDVEHEGHNYGRLSVSLGVAAFPGHGITAENLLRAADSALYEAKAGGRNQVRTAPGSE